MTGLFLGEEYATVITRVALFLDYLKEEQDTHCIKLEQTDINEQTAHIIENGYLPILILGFKKVGNAECS